MITADTRRAVAVIAVANAIESGCENVVAEEGLVMAALYLVIARRIARVAHDEAGAQAGAVLAAQMIATRTAQEMKEKLGG